MNRRKFLLSSIMTTGALALFPTSTIANSNVKALPCLSNLMNLSQSFSLTNLPLGFSKASESLLTTLKEQGYLFNVNSVVKLNNNCYAISVQKNTLLGFKSNELALLVKEGITSKHYILEEEMASEFNALIDNYSYNMNALGCENNVSDFAFPVKIREDKKGKNSVFRYQNNLDNTIILKKTKKGVNAKIC